MNDRGNCFYIFIFDDVQQSVKYILRRFTCRYTVPGCAHTFHIFPAHKIGVVFTCFRVQSILICQCTTTIRTFQQAGQPMLVNIRSLSVSHSGSNFCISFLCCIPQLLINEWLMFSVSDNFFSYSWRSTSATCTVPTDFSNIKRILKHISNIASFPALSSSCAITQVVNGRCDFCHRYMFDCEHVKASLNHRTIVFVDLRDSIGTFFFCISAWYICVVTAGKSLLCHATTNFTGKPDRVVFVHPFEDTLHKLTDHAFRKWFGYRYHVYKILL